MLQFHRLVEGFGRSALASGTDVELLRREALFIIDDIINAVGAENASQAQQKMAREAMALQRQMWEQQRADQAPWLQAGQTSLADMLRMTQGGFDPAQMAGDPGFQFRMAEGQKALERSAAARGGLASGGFMRGLARYSQGVASEEFGNRFSRLASLAGLGQGSAQSLGGLGSGYANSMSNLYGALGNAQAAGAMGVANGIGGAVRSAGDIGMMAATGGFSGLMGGGGAIPTQQPNPAAFRNLYGFGGG